MRASCTGGSPAPKLTTAAWNRYHELRMLDSRDDTYGARTWHIAWISFSVLALELAFIREIPAEVRAISYFTNLIFMASFFGLGLGCLLQRARSLAWLLPLGLG